MIFVDRSTFAKPEYSTTLRTISASQRVVDLLSKASDEHLSQLRVNFERDVWGNAIAPLYELFRSKCAYCESFLATSEGAVEHYRPRHSSTREPRGTGHLFYSWLAYDWDNLVLVCPECNVSRARAPSDIAQGQFPVLGKRAAFLSDVAACRKIEEPYLLDPCFDEPLDHLRCDQLGRLWPLAARGVFTIAALDLNGRSKLVAQRAQAYGATVRRLASVISSPGLAAERLDGTSFLSKLFDLKQPHILPRRMALYAVAARLQRDGDARLGLLNPLLDDEDWRRIRSNLNDTDLPEAVLFTPVRMGRYRGKRDLPLHSHSRVAAISIRNFKGIKALDLVVPTGPDGPSGVPGALTLLGENAAGKSSVLEAVAIALLGTEQVASLKLDGRTFLHAKGYETEDAAMPAEVEIRLDSGHPIILRIDSDGKFSGAVKPAAVLVGYGPRRYFAHHRNIKRFSAPWQRVRSMFDPTTTLPNPTNWLMACSERQFSAAVRALRTLLLLPEKAIVRRGFLSTSERREIFFELNGRIEQLSRLSDGYKTIVAMSVDIMRELLDYWPDLETARGMVLIDELDTHLHPRWKMRIASRLRTALPGVQFLTSTHDPLCLRGYYDGEVQVLKRGLDTNVERVSDLPNVRGLSVQQLLTSEFFGLHSTEDPDVDESIALYAELVSKSNRSPADEAELRELRANAGNTLHLGSGADGQLIQEAIGEFLLDRRSASPERSRALRRGALDKILEVWNSEGSIADELGDANESHD